MSVIDAVIFDFDGLILDTETAEYQSIVDVFASHGEELSFGLWQSYIGTTDHPHWCEILESQLGRAVERGPLIADRRHRNRKMVDALDVNAGVLELVAASRAAGLSLGVASSSPRDWVHAHLDHRGLRCHFDVFANGDEVERTKPDPAVYLLALERLGVDAERAIAIEDSVNGCRAAIAAGLAVVAVPSPMTRSMDFSLADLVVDSVGELDPGRLAAVASVRHS